MQHKEGKQGECNDPAMPSDLPNSRRSSQPHCITKDAEFTVSCDAGIMAQPYTKLFASATCNADERPWATRPGFHCRRASTCQRSRMRVAKQIGSAIGLIGFDRREAPAQPFVASRLRESLHSPHVDFAWSLATDSPKLWMIGNVQGIWIEQRCSVRPYLPDHRR
jgi:hypothetical protein